MKKIIIILLLLMISSLSYADWMGYFQTGDNIRVQVFSADTLGRDSTPDSVHLIVNFHDEATANSASYTVRYATAGAGSAIIDSFTLGGVTYYYFFDAVADIDNNEGTGSYSADLILFDQGEPFHNRFSFGIADSSINATYNLVAANQTDLNTIITYTDGDGSAGIDANIGSDGTINANIVEVGGDLITDNNDGRLETNVQEINSSEAAADSAAKFHLETLADYSHLHSSGDTNQVDGISTFNAASDSVTVDKSNLGTLDVNVTSVDADAIEYGDFAATAPTAWWNEGKTEYSLTQSFPTNFSDLSISATNGEVKILSTDTITTVIGNVDGSVASVTGKVTLVDSSAGDISYAANNVDDYKADVSDVTVGTNNDKTGYALSAAGNEAIADSVLKDSLSYQGEAGSLTAQSLWQYDISAFKDADSVDMAGHFLSTGSDTALLAGVDDVWRNRDTTHVDSSLIGTWLTNNLSGAAGGLDTLATSFVDAFLGRIADSVWLSLLEDYDGTAGSFGDSAQGWGATSASSITEKGVIDSLSIGLFDTVYALADFDTAFQRLIYEEAASAIADSFITTDSIETIIRAVHGDSTRCIVSNALFDTCYASTDFDSVFWEMLADVADSGATGSSPWSSDQRDSVLALIFRSGATLSDTEIETIDVNVASIDDGIIKSADFESGAINSTVLADDITLDSLHTRTFVISNNSGTGTGLHIQGTGHGAYIRTLGTGTSALYADGSGGTNSNGLKAEGTGSGLDFWGTLNFSDITGQLDQNEFADDYYTAIDSLAGSATIPDSLAARVDSILAALGYDADSTVFTFLRDIEEDSSGGGSGLWTSAQIDSALDAMYFDRDVDALDTNLVVDAAIKILRRLGAFQDTGTVSINLNLASFLVNVMYDIMDSMMTSTGYDSDDLHTKIDAIDVGSGLGANTCSLWVYETGNTVMVSDIYVRANNSSGADQGHTRTNTTGIGVLNLNDGDYNLVIPMNTGYIQTTNPQPFTVSGATNDTINVTLFSPSASVGDLCTVYGWLKDPDDDPLVGVKVSAIIPTDFWPIRYEGQAVRARYQVQTNASGYWEMSIYPNGLLLTAAGDSSSYWLFKDQYNLWDPNGTGVKVTVPSDSSTFKMAPDSEQ